MNTIKLDWYITKEDGSDVSNDELDHVDTIILNILKIHGFTVGGMSGLIQDDDA